MAGFVKVAKTDEISPGHGKLVEAGGKKIALFNVEGTFYAIASSLSSEYLSVLFPQIALIISIIFSSVAPFLSSFLRSCPVEENRHVTNFPSAVSLARVQVEQNGSVTDAMTPTLLLEQ